MTVKKVYTLNITTYIPTENSYEQVYETKQFCKQSSGDWTTQELQSQRPDLSWRIDYGNGVLYVGNNGGILACSSICQSIKDCLYFSTSETSPSYACFIYKTCETPVTSTSDYKIYRIVVNSNFWGNDILMSF